jgi:hypothetical protein
MIKDQKEFDTRLICSEQKKWKEKKIECLEKQLAQLKAAS